MHSARRYQDRANLGGAGERVIEFDVVGAGDAEGEGNAFVLQGAHDDVCAGHFHRSAGTSSRMRWATRSASAMMVT